MAIGNRGIGWSQEENLLWEVSRQLDRMTSIMCTGDCPTTTTTSSSTTTTTTTISPFENRFEYSPGNVPSLAAFEAIIGFALTDGVIEGDTIKFTNTGYTIPNNAFASNPNIIDVVSFANTVGQASFVGCSNLLAVSFPLAVSIGPNCFEVSKVQNIYIPNVTSLGFSPTDYSVFFDITSLAINLTINSVLTTINAGGMHLAIVYLQTYNTVTLIIV